MSEYASILIENLSLYTFRNYLDENIVSLLFSNYDLHVVENYKDDPADEDAEMYTKYEYKTTVKKAVERLEALGYSINNISSCFNTNVFTAIDYGAFLHHLHIRNSDDIESTIHERIEKKVTFQKWRNAIKKIVNYELVHGSISSKMENEVTDEISITTECDKIIYYALLDRESQSYYALFPDMINQACVIRMLLEYCPPEDEIVLDFSFLQYWTEDSIQKALMATESNEKTIVLVEGTSDKAILDFSLKTIYPHLSDLFYFMDFDDKNGARDGGTSYVVKNMKTFYFSKIRSRFIAIFDNDAEGYYSKCQLLNSIKTWPNNFRILLYPENHFFDSYPTLAPKGTIVNDNIKRKACSIELYLPDKVLQADGKYYPIEWEARRKIVNTDGKEEALYQGVISHKSEIKANFFDYMKSIENKKTHFNPDEWKRMKGLLDSIVFAFT